MKEFVAFLKNSCCLVGAVCIIYYFCLGFFGVCSEKETWHPNKMSQVTVPPEKALWQKQGIIPSIQPEKRIVPQVFLQPWDREFVPYAAWRARQDPCVPDRPY